MTIGTHASARRRSTRRLHTPTFEQGGETCIDFRPERLKELIGLEE